MVSGNGHRPPATAGTPGARRVRLVTIVLIVIALGALALGGYFLVRDDDPADGARAWPGVDLVPDLPATGPPEGRVDS